MMKKHAQSDENPVYTALSVQQDPLLAAQELAQSLCGEDVACILFFCAAEYDIDGLSLGLQRHFGSIPVVGCTTAGELTPLGYMQGSITAIGFRRPWFAIETALIEDLPNFDFADAQTLMTDMISRCQQHQVAPFKQNTFLLSLLDGLSVREEVVLNALNAAFGSIPLLGGSAGDDLNFGNTHVYYQGRFYSEAAVLILVNTTRRFEVFSQKSFADTDSRLVVTEVDSQSRRVYELDAEPAAEAYARLVGVSPDELSPMVFALNPLGVRIGGESFVRAIQQAHDDGSLTFYCAIERGIVLRRMVPKNIEEELARLFAEIRQTVGEPQLVIGCDCILRKLEIDSDRQTDAISRLMVANKVIGFNTYGEHLDGMHINQTFTGVAIGGDRGGAE